MKKIIFLALIICFAITLSAQIPKGTYVLCNDIAKGMYIEKIVFNAQKITIYISGPMGVTMNSDELDYEVQEMNNKLSLAQFYFEYDKTNDILIFGETYTNLLLGNRSSQMSNSAKLIYNKSGKYNPDLISNNKVRILLINR